MGSKMGLIVCSLIIMVTLLKGATAKQYVAGDSFGWTIPPNTSFYSDWANSKTFQIGDDILFKWNGTWTHNVAKVSSRVEYESCAKPGLVFLSGISHVLTNNGSYFFVCTVDNHCDLGMKMIVTVGSPTNVSAINDLSSASSSSFGSLVATLLSTIIVSLFTYV
ncbi:stellacyanin-like [Humulus lupulus]|uniref:stellacyanin-like n=1 Tax=Humulus lupulus TaxID=3486 RepID=UPI002B402EE1|nr:stellacyanin-like [Humulus lupulus]